MALTVKTLGKYLSALQILLALSWAHRRHNRSFSFDSICFVSSSFAVPFSLLVLGFFLLFHLVTSGLYLNLLSQALIHSFFLLFLPPFFCLLAVTECAHLAPCTRNDGIVFHVSNNEYFFLFFNYINILQNIYFVVSFRFLVKLGVKISYKSILYLLQKSNICL